MATDRVANPSRAERLFKLRRAQIEAAYEDRLDPNMSKAARRALEEERTRQLALARSEFARLSHAKPPAKKKKITAPKKSTFERRPIKPVPPRKTRQIPVGGIAHMIDTSERKPPPPREEMPVSDKWTYFDPDTGEPVSPWEIERGVIGAPDDEEEIDVEEEGMFADEDYSYADIEADWGGYDHTDTGYADENA